MADKTTPNGGFSAQQLDATSETACQILAEVGSNAAELVQAWVRDGNAAAVVAAAEQASGGARKAARRGLNVLKSRGVAIPDRRRVARIGRAEGEVTYEAWMMAPDSTGSVLLVIAARSPASRYQSASVILNDAIGVQRVDVGEMSQSQLKDSMARILPNAEYRPVPVPVEWARWRVAEARKRNAAAGAYEPLGLASAARLLEPVPTDAPPHPVDEEGLVLSDEDAQQMSKASGKLHGWPEFKTWFAPKPAVDEMLFKVGQTLTPDQEPDQADLQKTLDEQIRAATDRYFSPQLRERLSILMKDSALSVLQRAGEQAALEVVAATKAVESAGLITSPPHEIPFLRAFFDKAIAVLLAQGGGQLRIPVPRRPPAAVGSDVTDETSETESGSEPTDGSPGAEPDTAATDDSPK